jgi:hypothetical protein
MLEIGWQSAVSFLGVLALASLSGMGVAGRARWLDFEFESGLSLAVGMALGPFLIGLAAVLALRLAPGASHAAHFWSVIALLLPLAALGVNPALISIRQLHQDMHGLPLGLLAPLAACGLLLFITLFTPLTQNDALEYAIIVDRMFELRSLASNPMLHPESEPSGFFAPWTHPPLFPALLYFAKLINPVAQMPALERLIGPWALILCGLLSASLVRLLGFRASGLAFIAVVTPPLAFLGAANGLIDSLAMLGFAVPMSLVAAGVRSGERVSILTGLALGAGAWAHSQSILLFPLVMGALMVRDRIMTGHVLWRQLVLTAAAGLAVGLWPYLWNIALFGTPVSDDRALLAILKQDWASYFEMDRGLSDWPARITYGLLKMITAPEAYGAVFLLALPEAITLIRETRVSGLSSSARPPQIEQQRSIALVPVIFIALYLLGVCATILAGYVTLVKNERYFLIILPAAAVLAAGLPSLAGRNAPSRYVLTRRVLTAVLLAQAGFLTAYAFDRNLILNRNFAQPFETTLRARGEFALSYFLRDHAPEQAIVLSLKAADMFYAKRKMVSHLDPRLLKFYASPTPQAARDELAKLGVSFVHVPSYAMPTFYNSPLKQILADPAQASLRFENNDGQIYELVASKGRAVKSVNAAPGAWPWEEAQGIVFGSRKRMGRLSGKFVPVSGTEFTSHSYLYQALSRHFSTTFRMGKDGTPVFAELSTGDEVVARLLLSGRCHFMIHAIEQPHNGGAAPEPRLVATAIVEPRTSPLDLPIRFRANSSGVALSLTASGGCNVNVNSLELLIISPDKAMGLSN